jgi:hypothetical protein
MDDGPGPPDARRLLRRLSYRKRLRARWAAALGIRLYEPDEAAAAIAVARRNMRATRDLWLGPLVFFGIFVPVLFVATSNLLGRIIGIVILVLYCYFWVRYGRWLWRRAVTRNLETLRNAKGPGRS